jgi:replication-associated recombination protein RarA
MITNEMLVAAALKRQSGTSLKSIAAEFNVTWQKLEKALRHNRESLPTVETAKQDLFADLPPIKTSIMLPVDGDSWVDKYRPFEIKDLLGQSAVRKVLTNFMENKKSKAFLFTGDTGTGKTSAAIVIARLLGCSIKQGECGGVYSIASGEQSSDAVRDLFHSLRLTPLSGSGWKVVIVNECDRMSQQAETIWLDRLESLPKKTVIIFSTNNIQKLAARFVDRCQTVKFASQGLEVISDIRNIIASIWKNETGKELAEDEVNQIVKDSLQSGSISFRRVVQALENFYMETV